MTAVRLTRVTCISVLTMDKQYGTDIVYDVELHIQGDSSTDDCLMDLWL